MLSTSDKPNRRRHLLEGRQASTSRVPPKSRFTTQTNPRRREASNNLPMGTRRQSQDKAKKAHQKPVVAVAAVKTRSPSPYTTTLDFSSSAQ